ncbi:hypothetical protein AB0J01_28135 [Streptomyces sp. NPDC050204]|uniref:hypothetical protein n=1 Tax=Streptomyces sp. NPDC050204 TaxID=3155514 RepID=UPI00341FAC84
MKSIGDQAAAGFFASRKVTDHDIALSQRSPDLLGALLLGTTGASWGLRVPGAMSPFSIYVEFGTALGDGAYDDLLGAVTHLHGAVGPADNGNASLRITLECDSALQAAMLATEAAQAAGLRCGLPLDSVVGIEVTTEAEADRRLSEESSQELAGLAEAGDIIGVDEDTLASLTAELAPHLVQQLAGGPVYRAAGVRQVAAAHRLSLTERTILTMAVNAEEPAAPRTGPALPAPVRHLPDGTLHIHTSGADPSFTEAAAALTRRGLLQPGPGHTSEAGGLLVRASDRGRRHHALTKESPGSGT